MLTGDLWLHVGVDLWLHVGVDLWLHVGVDLWLHIGIDLWLNEIFLCTCIDIFIDLVISSD